MHYYRQRVDLLLINEYIQTNEIARTKINHFVVQRGESAADRFKPVEEVQNDLRKR